jgi:hypothetical protein
VLKSKTPLQFLNRKKHKGMFLSNMCQSFSVKLKNTQGRFFQNVGIQINWSL